LERKSFDNLLGDLGAPQALHHHWADLSGCPVAVVVVEAQFADFVDQKRLGGRWPAGYVARALAELSAMHPKLPIVFAGNRKLANLWTQGLFLAHQARQASPELEWVREVAVRYDPVPRTAGVDEQIRAMVRRAMPAEFALSDLASRLPGVAISRIRRVVGAIRAEGRLHRAGSGRNARWVKVNGPPPPSRSRATGPPRPARPRGPAGEVGVWRGEAVRHRLEDPSSSGGYVATLRDILMRKGYDVVSVGPTETVLQAANLMNDRGIGGVVVLDGDNLLGIFTERDILRRVVAQGRDPATTPVAHVMSAPVLSAGPDLTLDACAALMTERRVRHLPVRDDAGLIGLITTGDLLAHQVSEQETTIEQMRSYIYDLR